MPFPTRLSVIIPYRVRKRWNRYRLHKLYPNRVFGFDISVTGKLTLGNKARVGTGTVLNNVSIGNEVIIEDYCRIDNSLVGDASRVGAGSILVNSQLGIDIHIGENTNLEQSHLEDHLAIYHKGSLSDSSVGRYSYVAANSILNKTSIGRFCSIGPEFISGYGEHPTSFVSTSPVFYSTMRQCGTTFARKDLFDEVSEIWIGNDVWIGARVFVRNGVRIGNGAIIGAGAVVVRDVPDYAVVGGVPAKTIRMRFDNDTVKKLLQIEWWNWPEERLLGTQRLIAQSDVRRFIEELEN